MALIKPTNKRKRKPFWFEHNQDAPGYPIGDNRVMPENNRREVVRRTWNF